MLDVLVLEAAHHVDDGVDLADVVEELVAEAFTLARALHQSGDIDELHRGGHDTLRRHQLLEAGQPGVGHHHDAGVGLDGRKRVVGNERTRGRERVEERGLADVGEADDTESKHEGGVARQGQPICRARTI